MEDKILVSVVIVTYNHEKYIKEALESVLIQKTNFQFEILIGDDSSTDNTQRILKEYKEKYPNIIELYIRDTNIGGSRNILDIFKKCKGKYISPLEGDDYWLNEKRLQIMVDFLEANSEFVAVSHIRERRNEMNQFLGYEPPMLINNIYSFTDFDKGVRFSAYSSLFSNYHLKNSSKFDEILLLSKNVSDFQAMMILIDTGPIFVLSNCLGVYRERSINGESNYNSITSPYENYIENIEIIRRVDEFFLRKYNFNQEIFSRQFNAIFYSLLHGEYRNLLRILANMRLKELMYFIKISPSKIFRRLFLH